MTVDAVFPAAGIAEPVSSATHLLGALAFLVLAVQLLRRGAHGAAAVAALIVFGASSVLLLSLSGTYHMLERGGEARDVLQQLDHAAIFVLIAGSLTAVHLVLFRGPWRWGMIVAAWGCCALGVILKAVFFEQTPEALGLGIYLGMGWLGMVTTVRLWQLRGLTFVRLLLAGGLVYTVGALVDFLRMPVVWPGVIGPHELFHVCVIIALGLHWRFMADVLARRDRFPSSRPTTPAPPVTGRVM